MCQMEEVQQGRWGFGQARFDKVKSLRNRIVLKSLIIPHDNPNPIVYADK